MGFDNLVRDMVDCATKQGARFVPNSISRSRYEQWKKQFTFDALKNQKYGQSFCNYFGIVDKRILYESNWLVCDTVIQREWLARS